MGILEETIQILPGRCQRI